MYGTNGPTVLLSWILFLAFAFFCEPAVMHYECAIMLLRYRSQVPIAVPISEYKASESSKSKMRV